MKSTCHLFVRALLMSVMIVLLGGCAVLPQDVPRRASTVLAPLATTALGRVAAASTQNATLSGFRLLPAGDFALDTRLELIKRAERSLDLQYFLVGNDPTGRETLRELRDAAKRGVRVRLLIDDLFTSGQDALLLGLAAYENAEVRLFNPFPLRRGGLFLRFLGSATQFDRLNHRMHNKLFVADGVMAVTGGRNVADEYFLRHPLANFIDLDVFAIGAVVPQLGEQFDRYWNSSYAYPIASIAPRRRSEASLRGDFDRLVSSASSKPTGPVTSVDALGYGPIGEELEDGKMGLLWGRAEAYADPPGPVFDVAPGNRERDKGPESVRLNVLEHVRASREEVALVTPYLIPGKKGMALLEEMGQRQVDVSILTNSLASTDQPIVHLAYQRYRKAMLRAGVDLYELSPVIAGRASRGTPMGVSIGGLHTKAAVFDRTEVFIGSMNFDPRSEHYNTEMGLFIESPELAREVIRLTDLAKRRASHRLRLTADDRIVWLSPSDTTGRLHEDEPDTSRWLRFILNLVAPVAPEQLL